MEQTGHPPETRREFPCSQAQRSFWVLDQLDPGAPSLNIAERWRLDGEVAHRELEEAFRLLVARHPALRTCFAGADGERVQIVVPQVRLQVPLIDLSALPEVDALAEAERIAAREARIPFDLSAPPLLRATQLRIGERVSLLLVTVHHIVCDPWSLGILARELGEMCAALQAKRAQVLPPLPTAYGAFSARQAQERTSAAVRSDTRYWERLLDGVPQFELQPDHPRPPVQTVNSAVVSRSLDRRLTRALAEVARLHQCTLYVTGLSILLTLLHRYTGETDIAIGGRFDGRDEPGLERLVGLFVETLVLRNDLSGDPSFGELLARVRECVDAALEHRHVAPETLVETMNRRREPGRHPLYSVHWSCHRAFVEDAAYRRFGLRALSSHPTGAISDLDFSMIEKPEGAGLSCEFNTDLFDEATVTSLLDRYENLLRGVVNAPWRKLSALPLLGAAERHALIVDCNRTAADYPRDATLPQLFAAQVARTPEATALVCGERRMSYRELDVASSRLAHELRRHVAAPAQRVAVVLDRSPDLVVALLAASKAGSAYIPIDPSYPAQRIAHVFESSQPAAIITRASLAGGLPECDAPVIRVDTDAEAISRQVGTPPDDGPRPDDLAYVIYTSGSTGRPKGVQIPHRALVNLLWAMRNEPGMSDRDVVLSVTTISFDIAALEIFLPLITGARLVVAREEEAQSGSALLALLRRHRVTLMQATPVTWSILVEAGWHGDPPLRMLCGGEAMPRKLAESLLARGGELWNMYGPTETTIWSSALRVESGTGPVPIGGPIANTQFYVLDARGELVPPGAPGELYIGGDGIAAGYHGMPEMTAERFVPDLFADDPDARLYRTGDIVRMRRRERGGCWIEFLGRTDHQVKLRGFRIELGEIESALLAHPDLVEAVAIVGSEPSGQQAIWAYVVPRRDAAEQAEALVGALRASAGAALPAYMHPASIIVLDTLPRTPNGKIDRARLPAPAPATRKREKASQPANEIERRVAKIWSSVLGLPDVERTADFFELGGHSLLAARLLSRIDAEFGQRLSLVTLFKAPTVEAQAKLLRTGEREFDFRHVVRLHPNGSRPPLIAIHNTGVYYYRLAKQLGPEQPLATLQLFDPTMTHAAPPPQRLEDIAAEYVRLIRQVQPEGPYQLMGWCVGGVLAYEVARQLTSAHHEVSLLALIDTWVPGYLGRLPKWRARLADYSFRWQLILADWRRTTSGQQGFGAFLARRTFVKRLLRWAGKPVADAAQRVAFEDRGVSPEHYDRWLLGYLEDTAARYEPGGYAGRVTLLRSALEPSGPFLDPQMGWRFVASGMIDVVVLDGDHFTVFQGQGVQQMAEKIASALEASARLDAPAEHAGSEPPRAGAALPQPVRDPALQSGGAGSAVV